MIQPLVTVVTPSLNQAGFLRAAIESVLSQNYPRLEYIIMDGGSSDGSAAIAAEYGSRLTWISGKDRGQTHAINMGFQRAAGDVVAWLNSDDVYLPGAVTAAAAAFEETPAVGAIYGGGYCIDRSGETTMRFPFTGPFNLWRLTWLCDYILQQSTFFRRSAVAEAGWLDESLHWAMDWDILVRLGKRHGLRYIPVELGCLREYGETKTASGGAARFRELKSLLRRQTGAFWPPGCWYYGLDTYDRIWSAALRQAGAGKLAERLYHLCRYKIDRTALHAQGYYEDGWAGPRLHWMLPCGASAIYVRGESSLEPAQTLSLTLGRRVIARREFRRGSFDWRVQLPKSASSEAVTFTIRAGRHGVGANGSERCWRVVEIQAG